MVLIINNATRCISTFLFLSLFLTACSSSKDTHNANVNQKNQNILNNKDPLEKYNRRVFAFNLGLDDYLLKPAAKAYRAVTPEFVDTSVSNFFGNLGDVGNAINNVLQFKLADAVNDTERFIFNTTFGFAGLVDIASAAGLEKHNEDFGQTLATWGVKSGPYIMLTFFGPSTIRDVTAKFSVDRLTDPTHYSSDGLPYFALKTIDKRADLFSQEEAFKDISDDQYSALRDAWLQRRAFLISDGKINEESHSDLIDELERLESQ